MCKPPSEADESSLFGVGVTEVCAFTVPAGRKDRHTMTAAKNALKYSLQYRFIGTPVIFVLVTERHAS